MKLYCMRHGQALPPSAEEPDPILSPQGEQEIKRLGAYLQQKGVSVSYAFSSYKKRAKQTAALCCEQLACLAQPEEHDLLDPTRSIDRLVAEAETWCDDTLLVGHMPHIGQLVSQLVSKQACYPLVRFTPGTIVCLERGEGDQWSIEWVIQAKLLTD